jgi:hypothetical protein
MSRLSPTGLKTRGYSPSAARLSDVFPLLRGIVFLKSSIEKPYEKDAVE